MLEALIPAAGAVVAAGGAIVAWAKAKRTRRPLMLQWGRFVGERAGTTDPERDIHEDEIVHYEDFRYWLRLSPNPGINLPVIGYWSKANGRKRR